VESTAGFQVGDEVALIADGMGGWYMPHGLVKEISPTRLVFAEALDCGHPEGLFSPEKRATAVNYFPFVCVGRRHSSVLVVGIAVLDLTIDGNLKENPGPWSDFTLAAIHLAGVSDSLVRNVSVCGSVGDGIGVQGGSDNRIESCLVENCRGHGYHPGTGLRGAVFANNIGRHNNGDGLYFCCDVVGITVTGNLLHDNQGSGIGGLGEGCGTSDRFNVVANNICRHNGLWGIQAIGGRNNVITGNVCLDNSQSQPGRYSGICLVDTTHTTVTSNHCSSDQQKPTQRLGIEESGQSNHNVISGDLCEGNVEGGIAVVGADTQVLANVGTLTKAAM
jgi:parallel beta-helix repeat protein